MRRVAFLLVLAAQARIGFSIGEAAQWNAEPTVVSDPGRNMSLGAGDHPAVLDSQGRIHVFLQERGEDGLWRIVHVTRASSGAWEAREIASSPGRNARNATAALDHAGRIHVVWEDGVAPDRDIAYRMVEPDGTWAPEQRVSPAPGESRGPCVVVDAADRVHVVWVDKRNLYPAVLHCSAPPGGEWGEAQPWTGPDDGPDLVSGTADSVGSVFFVWRQRQQQGGTRPTFGLFLAQLNAGSDSASAPVPLVSLVAVSTDPFLQASPDGTVHLVWLDNRGMFYEGAPFMIYYKRYLPGIGWGKDKRFSYDTVPHMRPVAVPGPGKAVNIAWEDYAGGNPEIAYRQITPETGWDPKPTRITADLSASVSPVILSREDGRLFLFWTDLLPSGNARVLVQEGRAYPAP